MRFFKYIFVLISLFFAQNALANCPAGSLVQYADSPLPQIGDIACVLYNPGVHCESRVDSFFLVVDAPEGKGVIGKLTGKSCKQEEQPYICTQDSCPVTEEQRCPVGYVKGMYNGVLSCVKNKSTEILECTSDSCPNPDQKRCPANYYGGSINGQNVCIKRTESTDTDYPTDEESKHFDIVSSVNNAKNAIVDSIYSLSDTLSTNFNALLGKLDEVNSNGTSIGTGTGGEGTGTGTGGEGTGETPDLGVFDVDVPSQEFSENDSRFQLKQNNFSSTAVCPSDKVLNIPFLNRSFTYTFSFATICNGLQIIGYFILTMCYLYSANILVRI